MIHIFSDYAALEREFDRVEHMPDYKTARALDGLMDEGLVLMKAATHVETGSLVESETVTTDTDRSKWTGTLEAGGASGGPNNPVSYAIYEKARGEGGAGGPSDAKGNHDFTAGLKVLHPQFVGVIKKGLAG